MNFHLATVIGRSDILTPTSYTDLKYCIVFVSLCMNFTLDFRNVSCISDVMFYIVLQFLRQFCHGEDIKDFILEWTRVPRSLLNQANEEEKVQHHKMICVNNIKNFSISMIQMIFSNYFIARYVVSLPNFVYQVNY